jgi:hypothetical protein
MIRRFLVFSFIIIICVNNSFSQSLFSNTKYQLETGTYLSTSGITPFWLRSNQYGIVPLSSPMLTFRASAHKEYDSTRNNSQKLKKIGYGYGFWGAANVGKQSSLLLPEAYLKIRYGVFEIYGGRKREIVGLVDTMLTSGSFIWSGNALPMPKIQISVPNYTSIIGHGLISVKGAYAHGWFNNGIVKSFYLHQKWLYGRIGKSNWKIKFYGGANHQVQWGGTPLKPYIEAKTGNLISNFSSDFRTYLNVVTGVSLNKNETGTNSGIPLNEALNRAGNHLGTIDIATEVSLKKMNLLLYRQNIYDDGSLFFLNNISDGLLGFSIKRKFIHKGIDKISFEYLNTTSQGGNLGSENGNSIPQLRGQDNYFTNAIYLDGWTYYKSTIGTPFISHIETLSPRFTEKYNLNNLPYGTSIINSRLKLWKVAFHGKYLKIQYLSKIALTNNYGSFNFDSFSLKQFSFEQQMTYVLYKYLLTASLSIDRGKLYGNSSGCYLGIRRAFF